MLETIVIVTKGKALPAHVTTYLASRKSFRHVGTASSPSTLADAVAAHPTASVLVDLSTAADQLGAALAGPQRKTYVIAESGLVSLCNTQRVESETSADSAIDSQAVYVRYESKISRIALTDLLYVEAQKDYVVLHTAQKAYKILGSMKRIASELGDVDFYRAHRSYIVRLDKISHVEGEYLKLHGASELVPLGPNYRSPLLKGVRLL